MFFIYCSKLKIPFFSLLLLHSRKPLNACRGKRGLEKIYLSLDSGNTPVLKRRSLYLKKNVVLDRFPAVAFQNVTYSFRGINNDAHRDLNIDEKLNSWVSTTPTHNTDIIRICFMPSKETIENKRKGSSIRVCQKCQLCISYIYISLQSPLTKQQLNE